MRKEIKGASPFFPLTWPRDFVASSWLIRGIAVVDAHEYREARLRLSVNRLARSGALSGEVHEGPAVQRVAGELMRRGYRRRLRKQGGRRGRLSRLGWQRAERRDRRRAGSAAGGGGSGATTGGQSTDPVIDSVPPAWERPEDCGGIGDSCQEELGCGPRSFCQFDWDVCIPWPPEGSSRRPTRSSEYPYCAALTCMTFEEASCFCTGDGVPSTVDCSSPGALAGLCGSPNGSCMGRPCCDGLTCVDLGSSRVCQQPCSKDSDCESGCCTDRYDTGDLVCAEPEACMKPCKKRGEACTPATSSSPTDCCQGTCVTSQNPELAGCRPSCTENEHCDTGCCVPLAGSANGYCASAEYCSYSQKARAAAPTSRNAAKERCARAARAR